MDASGADVHFWGVRPSPFQTLSAGGRLERHRHADPYAALVLSGGYVEAGDQGRIHARPGQVLIHGRWESHMDAVSGSGARVLNLPLAFAASFALGEVDDADLVARAAESDPVEAARLLAVGVRPLKVMLWDWPDRLADALRRDPALVLETWAETHALAPETVSRGFHQAFGTPPRRYRAEQRALRAVHELTTRPDPPASIAIDLGFADQAHMSRAVRALTGLSPGRLRVKSVQSAERRTL